MVAVPTELDLTIAEELRDVLLGVLNAGAVGLVVDLTMTTFCDSAGITAITRAVRRSTASDATVRLAVTSTPVLRVLNLVGIDRLIGLYQPTTPTAALMGQAIESLTIRNITAAGSAGATFPRLKLAAMNGRQIA